LALNDALDQLTLAKAQAAELVKLRFFAGLTNEDAAASMGVSPRKQAQFTLSPFWPRFKDPG
jgi:hypothetical protein